jgi:hypothetical protein
MAVEHKDTGSLDTWFFAGAFTVMAIVCIAVFVWKLALAFTAVWR